MDKITQRSYYKITFNDQLYRQIDFMQDINAGTRTQYWPVMGKQADGKYIKGDSPKTISQ